MRARRRQSPRLEALGHNVVAPDLLPTTTAGRKDLVLVAQSLGGLVVPLVCRRLPVRLVVMVAAMVPKVGESPGQWWADTGWEQARQAQLQASNRPQGIDVMEDFFHDVSPDVTAAAFARGERYQSGAIVDRPYPMPPCPDVPTRFVLCRNDRFFPAPFMRKLVTERLGIVPDELDSGHLAALAHPKELADRLDSYRLK